MKDSNKSIDDENEELDSALENHSKIEEFINDSETAQQESNEMQNTELEKLMNLHKVESKELKELIETSYNECKNYQLKQNSFNDSVLDLFDGLNKRLDEHENQINRIELLIKKQIEKENSIQDNTKLIYESNKNIINLFKKFYSDCKRYFFNGKEDLLKEYLNTDELFRMCYFNDMQFVSYSPSENKILLKTKEGIILATNNRFYTIKEVIGLDGYSVPQLYHFDDFVVFDIGMNRAYASLRFANFDNCSAVYGFEIDEETFNKAVYNINLNPHLSKKIKPYNFGLSNNYDNVKLFYLKGCDGVSTIESELIDVLFALKRNKNKIQTKNVEVKKASDVISNIIDIENITSKIVLKIDTEGSEYKIMEDIINSDLINKIDLILGEGHKFGDNNIGDDLLKYGFKKIEREEYPASYNFAYVKNKFYDEWPLKE